MLLVVAFACSPASGDGTHPTLGAPLLQLSAAELEAFARGRALFHREFTVADGLGPSFNDRRCSACHDVPVLGGMGAEFAPKATRYEDGRCDLLREHGGDMIQHQVTDQARALGLLPERIPATATGTVNMAAPPLFGMGLIAAIPEAAIVRRADPHDRNGDGIAGRAGVDPAGRFTRFGRKAAFATLADFTADAFLHEMGLTTSAHPVDEGIGGLPLPPGADTAPDPEIDDESLRLIVLFVSLLAAPAPETPVNAAARDSIRRGERHFDRIGCTACHIPEFRTSSDVPALHNREVRLYSDLLLHDLGPERASVCAPHASPSEWRTQPLWGLRYRHMFLHDGAAQNIRSAIEAHGGAAARSRDGFRRLSPDQQDLLVRFLRSI